VFEDADLEQRFSTWGTRTSGGTWEVCRGYATFHNPLKISPFLCLGRTIF
jgi:hypothetical protein